MGGWGEEERASVYIFFILQMPLKWLLPLGFLRNPLIFPCSCQNLLGSLLTCAAAPLSPYKEMEGRALCSQGWDNSIALHAVCTGQFPPET